MRKAPQPRGGGATVSAVYDESNCLTLPVCLQMSAEQRHAQALEAQLHQERAARRQLEKQAAVLQVRQESCPSFQQDTALMLTAMSTSSGFCPLSPQGTAGSLSHST